MLRVVLIVLVVVLAALTLRSVAGWLRGRRVYWTGVTFFIGFIVVALWLRHVTGIG